MKYVIHQLIQQTINKNKGLKSIVMAGLLSTTMHAHSNQWENYQNNATQQFEAGQYSQAMKNAQQALKLAENGQGQTAPYIASSLNIMAMIADAQGDSVKAIEYMQRAIQLFQKNENTHENTATLLFNLAQFYQKQKQPQQALQTLDRADKILQTVLLKQQTPQLVTLQGKILSEIQQILLQQNQLEQAQQYAQRQYELITQQNATKLADPKQNLTVIRSLIILAQSYQQQNQMQKSNEILSDVFQRFQNIKGTLNIQDWQTDYADALEIKSRNARQTQQDLAVHTEAIDFYQQLSLEAQQKYQMRIANHYNEIGFYYFDRTEYAEALQYFNKAAPLMQNAYGQNSAEYARLLGNLAQVKDRQMDYQSALQSYQQAQDIYASLLLSSMSSDALIGVQQAYSQSLNNSAVIQYKLKEYQKAEQLWNKGLNVLSKDNIEQNQKFMIPILENLFRLYQAQKRKADEKRVQYQLSQLKKNELKK